MPAISRPARGDQRQGVLQREHARQAGRDELTDAVAEHGARRHAPGLPELGRCVADGEQRRLRQARVEECRFRCIIGGIQDRPEVQPEQRQQDVRTPVYRLAKHRLAIEQRAAHVRVLRALAREQEGSLAAAAMPGRRPPVFQRGDRVRMARASDRHAMGEAAPAGLQRVGDIGQVLLGVCRQMRHQTAAGGLQPGRTAGGEDQHLVRPCLGWGGRVRRLVQHRMRVGATNAEGADGGPAWRRAGPGLRPRRDAERSSLQGHRRVGRGEMQRARHGGVFHRHRRLQQPGHAGSGVQMADIALDGAEHAGAFRPEHLAQPGELDRVAQWRGGAVRLDVADAGGWKGGLRLRRRDAGDLAADTRGGEADLASAIIVGGRCRR